MAYTSHLPAVRSRLERAIDGALIAAATVVENDVKRRLIGGYTSGAFVTGNVLNSVTRTEPQRDAQGPFILVGTDVLYALFWEIGHHNLFTRKYERKEVWMPALLDTKARQLAAAQRVFTRIMSEGGGGDASVRRAASPRGPDVP